MRWMRRSSPRMTTQRVDIFAMIIHLNTQADLEGAIHALVKQDPRLKPIFELAGMPALRRREPGYAGLAAIICGQHPPTASAPASAAPRNAASHPVHHT